jgi:hypothetical protein
LEFGLSSARHTPAAAADLLPRHSIIFFAVKTIKYCRKKVTTEVTESTEVKKLNSESVSLEILMISGTESREIFYFHGERVKDKT